MFGSHLQGTTIIQPTKSWAGKDHGDVLHLTGQLIATLADEFKYLLGDAAKHGDFTEIPRPNWLFVMYVPCRLLRNLCCWYHFFSENKMGGIISRAPQVLEIRIIRPQCLYLEITLRLHSLSAFRSWGVQVVNAKSDIQSSKTESKKLSARTINESTSDCQF